MNFLVFDDDISKVSKRFGGVIRDACEDYGFSPRIRSTTQASTALFETSNGKGVMFFSDWDSPVSNPIYGYVPLKRRLPVMLFYYSEKLTREAMQLVEAAKKKSEKGRAERGERRVRSGAAVPPPAMEYHWLPL